MTGLAMRPGGPDDVVAPEPRDPAQKPQVAPVATAIELIDFELEARPTGRRSKARAVRRRFGCSTGTYYQALHRAVWTEQAAKARPGAVVLLRRELDERRLRRALVEIPVPRPAEHHSRDARPHRATGGTMDGQSTLVLPVGEAEKQLGMARADEAAETAWKERVDDAIRSLAEAGGEFTADDVREITGAPPSHPNAMGARFYAMSKRGVIRRVGFRKSGRASLHAHHIALWTGTRPKTEAAQSDEPQAAEASAA